MASGAVPEIAQAAEAPVIEKLLTTDVEVTADGLSTQIVHEELQATNAASAMRLGQQAIPYIESIQDLEITEAYTLKSDGRKIPVNPQAIYVQQPRTGTDLQTIDDVRQKVIVFPDVAAGDVVSLTMKLRSKQTLLPGQFFFSAFFAHQQAFQEVRETIVAPKSLPLNVEAHEVEYKKEDTGNTFTYRFHYSAPQSVTDEVAAVSPLDHLPRFYVSSLANYNEFGRAYANVAASKEIVTPKIQALADQLTQGIGSQREQTKKIYEWVSAHIRYVAIELGRGSIVPHEAESVLINGYGDCKDHAILFAALLKAKGIDSQSVLINAGNSYTLSDVPAFAQLNHVITWLPDQRLYVDTTATVAPFGILPFYEYGKPVVHATKSGEVLRHTPVMPADLASVTITTDEHLDNSGQITGTTDITATGPYAIDLRSTELAIQSVGGERAAEKALSNLGENGTGNFFATPPLELNPSYSLKGNFVIQLKAQEMFGDSSLLIPEGLNTFNVIGNGLMGPYESGKLKATDPTPCWSGHMVEIISLELPAGKTFKWYPDDVKVKTANLEFTAHWSLSGSTVSVRREFTSHLDQAICTGKVRGDSHQALEQIYTSFTRTIALANVAAAAPGADTKSKGTTPAVANAALQHERDALQSAIKSLQANDLKSASETIKAIFADATFPLLNDDEQYAAYVILGTTASNAGDFVASNQAFQHATTASKATGWDWEMRFDTAYRSKNYQDSALSLIAIATKWPKSLSDISDTAILTLNYDLAKSPADAELRAQYLRTLYDAKWKPTDPFRTAEAMWFHLALIQLEKGRTAQARSIAESITLPTLMIEMRADKRFDAIISSNPDHYNVDRAFDQELASEQKQRDTMPDRLNGVHDLAALLIIMNQPAKALALLDDAISRAIPADGSKPAFTDVSDQLPWILNARADALFLLNRSDEAIDQLTRAAHKPEHNAENVSQTINLADSYIALGRAKDALATVADLRFDQMSAYGAMALEEARVCAYAQLQDDEGMRKALDYMHAHAVDAVSPLIRAELCANDFDGAANSFIDKLNNLATRSDALFRIQEFVDTPFAPPFDVEMKKRWKKLVARHDVQAAIKKVGRIEPYKILNISG